MRNVLAIAGKEIRGYFTSPIAYIVIGFFALLFGYFFYALLSIFERQSMQVQMQMGGGGMNINQMLIAPLLMNASVLVLFVLPMVTMRTYSEEKRSGTIELLLTSPVSDTQIILGKFLGAMTLYTALLAVTLIHIGILFIYGTPEWKPIVTAYLGLLLMGGCFISLGLFISSLTKNQIVAGMITFAVSSCSGSSTGSGALSARPRRRCWRICRSPSTSTTSRRASSTPNTWSIT